MGQKTLALFVLLMVLPGIVLQGEDVGGAASRTTITSQKMSFDYKRSIAVFDGNVVVRGDVMDMDCEHLAVLFEKDNSIKSATATGNVRLRSEEKTGTCDKSIYIAKTEEVILMGKATLRRGKDAISGDKIVFYINDDKVTCEPAHLVFFSEKKDLKDVKVKEGQ